VSNRASSRLVVAAALASCLLGPAPAAAQTQRDRDVYVRVTPDAVVLGNAVAERRWDRAAFRTATLTDKRAPARVWSRGQRDFTLSVAGTDLGSEAFTVARSAVERLPRGGLRVTMALAPGPGSSAPLGLTATRVAEAYPGIAGFRTQTVLESATPLALAAVTLDEAAVGPAAPTLHNFRAGADYRDPGEAGPPISNGDASAGLGRTTKTAARGTSIEDQAQWLSVEDGGRSLFSVMERNAFLSGRGSYDGRVAALRVNYARDLIYTGPGDGTAQFENPLPGPARQRMVRPGVPFRLEPAFTGFGKGGADEQWQFYRYLTGHRLNPYPKAVTFNSNGVDENRISTGAKDDMDLGAVRETAALARQLGVETFILDDGWQAISGDWQPDSPDFRDPRAGRDPVKFAPRFPDAEFGAVREAIAPMRLGTWMSPLQFNPASRAFAANRDWICSPVGDALLAFNTLTPDDSANEAGIVPWGPRAIPYVESRVRDEIEGKGVVYFKFDFMAFVDCANQGTDFYDLHDEFVAMIDRVQRDHPEVTFQIDETNDFRLFPFESASRGPTWFQGSFPAPERLLHNLWNLSPYVPAFSVGQAVLGKKSYEQYPVATLMAGALPSHITFFDDIRQLPPAVVAEAARWTGFYKRNREQLAQFTHPLLADPLEKGWTALQPWNRDTASGALLAFRQEAGEPAKTIALRDIPPGRRFDLFEGPTGKRVATVTSERLTRGLRVSLPQKRQARVLLIRPAQAAQGPGAKPRPQPRPKPRPRARRRPAGRAPRFTG